MPDRETVEGWSNYPTWSVNLWLANDRKLNTQTRALVAACTAAPFEWRMTGDMDRRGEVADALKRFVEDLVPDLGATFPAQLLAYAVDCVDWYELAEEWISNAAEVTA